MPKAAPKPRVAIYGGIAVGTLAAGGIHVISSAARGRRLDAALVEATNIGNDPAGAVSRFVPPAAGGLLLSWAADKLGVNKMLAKARFPLRV